MNLVHGAVDDLHHPEHHEGDEEEVDDGADEGADGEDAHRHLVKVRLAADQGDDGVDDGVYDAIDDGSKGTADDHAHSQVDDVAAGDEVLKFADPRRLFHVNLSFFCFS